MLEAKNGEELLRICEAENIPLSEYAIRIEMEKAEITREEAEYRLKEILGEDIRIKEWIKKIKIIKLIVDNIMFILYNVYILRIKGVD